MTNNDLIALADVVIKRETQFGYQTDAARVAHFLKDALERIAQLEDALRIAPQLHSLAFAGEDSADVVLRKMLAALAPASLESPQQTEKEKQMSEQTGGSERIADAMNNLQQQYTMVWHKLTGAEREAVQHELLWQTSKMVLNLDGRLREVETQLSLLTRGEEEG